MKRSPLRRGKTRVGAAARRRVRAGGVLAKGRQSLTLALWRDLVAQAIRLDRGRCANPRCRKKSRLEPHHVIKRSAGGPDAIHNVLSLCHACHRRTDLPLGERLVVFSLGPGRFAFEYPEGDPEVHDRNLDE